MDAFALFYVFQMFLGQGVTFFCLSAVLWSLCILAPTPKAGPPHTRRINGPL